MMRTIRAALLTIVALTFSFTLQAQYAGATLSYVKVKDGQQGKYLELEKEALKFHQARVEKGIITRWALYKKMYGGADDPYDYILVQVNDDFMKTENAFPKELIDALYTEEEQSDFMKKAGATRKIVKQEYYERVTASEEYHPFKYLRFIRYYVKPEERGLFTKQRKEMVKPVFDEVVKRKHHSSWGLWKKDPHDKKFQYVAVNAFAEFGDWKKDVPFSDIFKEIFPDKDFDKTVKEIMQTRYQVNSEYWKLVMNTEPASAE